MAARAGTAAVFVWASRESCGPGENQTIDNCGVVQELLRYPERGLFFCQGLGESLFGYRYFISCSMSQ